MRCASVTRMSGRIFAPSATSRPRPDRKGFADRRPDGRDGTILRPNAGYWYGRYSCYRSLRICGPWEQCALRMPEVRRRSLTNVRQGACRCGGECHPFGVEHARPAAHAPRDVRLSPIIDRNSMREFHRQWLAFPNRQISDDLTAQMLDQFNPALEWTPPAR